MKTKLSAIGCAWMLIAGLAPQALALPAVQIYGEASSSGPEVTVRVYADITGTSILSYTFRVFYDPGKLAVAQATRNAAVWYFSDGTNQLDYMNPDASQPGEVLFIGGRFDATNPLAGVSGTHVLLGTVVFTRVTANTPAFSVAVGRQGHYANFVTAGGTVLDAQPGVVMFSNVAPDPNDQDLDGLLDSWEKQYFGSIDKAYWSDDPDHDGYNNLAEQALGSNPKDPTSNLQMNIARQLTGVSLEWSSATGRVYTIESSGDLQSFQPVVTGIQATPPQNSYTIPTPGHAAAFYRVLLQSN